MKINFVHFILIFLIICGYLSNSYEDIYKEDVEEEKITIVEGASTPQKGSYVEYYQPSYVEILPYETVIWINLDSTGHTVTSGTPIDGPDGLFDSGIFTTKEVFLYTFDKEGTYPYFCQIHPWMDGKILVIESKQPTKDESIEIPVWVKKNARWWSENKIGDSDFVKGIEYLIKQEIIKVPKTNADTTIPESQKIPSWIKNNAGRWASNQIADSDFVKGIEYLIKSGIIKV